MSIFKLRENNTTVGTEIRAGIATFLTMSYIVFVQPIILSGTGLSWNTVFVATCISSAVTTLLMAFFANYPIALAPAMGHNVLFLMYCQDGTINWQTGLGAVCISGTLFIIMSFWGMRERIVHAVPESIKHAIAVGIGLLIAFIGFQWAGLAVDDPVMLVREGDLQSKPVLLALGGLLLTGALIALRFKGAILAGIIATAVVGTQLGITPTDELSGRYGNARQQGRSRLVAACRAAISVPASEPQPALAILPVQVPEGVAADVSAVLPALEKSARENYRKGTLAATPAEAGIVLAPRVEIMKKQGGAETPVLRVTARDTKTGKVWREYHPLPLSEVGKDARLAHYAKDVVLGLPGHDGLLKFDVVGAFKLGLLHVIFIFFFLDLFDTIGTLIGVSQQAGFLKNGMLPRARGAMLADACGTVLGALLGTSTVTSYIESSAGVAEGGRTGLANVVTALLFIVALFCSPLVRTIGGDYHGLHPAVAPVLIIIGSIMMSSVLLIKWGDATEALPSFLAIMMMPLTFSITEGIAFGFISYSFLKLVTGRGREVNWLVYLFSILFIVRYAYVGR